MKIYEEMWHQAEELNKMLFELRKNGENCELWDAAATLISKCRMVERFEKREDDKPKILDQKINALQHDLDSLRGKFKSQSIEMDELKDDKLAFRLAIKMLSQKIEFDY
jgi:hypothetical protein